jgi:hypothetical protein
VVNEASEEPPTQRVYPPGSTTHCRSAFQTASWFCGIRNTTVLVSCGLRWIRENPLSERLGVSTLLTSSRKSSWATSSPWRSPELVISTVTTRIPLYPEGTRRRRRHEYRPYVCPPRTWPRNTSRVAALSPRASCGATDPRPRLSMSISDCLYGAAVSVACCATAAIAQVTQTEQAVSKMARSTMDRAEALFVRSKSSGLSRRASGRKLHALSNALR